MKQGFFRVAAVSPRVFPGNVQKNVDHIMNIVRELEQKDVELVVFPEMSLTGYTIADLVLNSRLIEDVNRGLARLQEFNEQERSVSFVVGAPIATPSAIYNCAVLFSYSSVTITAKTNLPNYGEFYEKRWFSPAPKEEIIGLTIGKTDAIFLPNNVIEVNEVMIGMEVCEDMWVPIPPSSRLALKGAEVIVNISASDAVVGKEAYVRQLIAARSGSCTAAYVYAAAGEGESSTDLVFLPHAYIAEGGAIVAETHTTDVAAIRDIDIEAIRYDRRRSGCFAVTRMPIIMPFDETTDLAYRSVSPYPFLEGVNADTCDEIIDMQAHALLQRLNAIGCKRMVIGVSGGLDSTLALLAMHRACTIGGIPTENIIAVTMPGLGTTKRTRSNAGDLMEMLGVTALEIPIVDAVLQHFHDIGQDPQLRDVTYENAQARERTQVLMDLANQHNAIVIGTGDMSELALGWATYNGDHMSMYGLNAGIPKTLVRRLVEHCAEHADSEPLKRVLTDIVNTPISPELLPSDNEDNIAQKTEDTVGPYPLNDFFLYYTLRYGFTPERILLLACKAFGKTYPADTVRERLNLFNRRFFTQQYKRSCIPDGPKILSVSLSPRGDWRMPSDASFTPWLIKE